MILEQSQPSSQSLCLPEELTITAIRGYRELWFVDGLFMSHWDKTIWPVDAPHVATCKFTCQTIPCLDMVTQNKHGGTLRHAGFGCGLYAWDRPEAACPNMHAMTVGFRSNPRFWGVVETQGKSTVIKHKLGFRASNLRIVAIANSHRHAPKAAKIYNVPCLSYTDLVNQFPPQQPFNIGAM